MFQSCLFYLQKEFIVFKP